MSQIVDEYSFNNPKNQGNGKWQRLVPLPANDPLYSISKSSSLLSFCSILRLLRFNNQSRIISLKAGNIPINRTLNFKEYTKFYGPTRASNLTTTIGKSLLNMEITFTNASLEHL